MHPKNGSHGLANGSAKPAAVKTGILIVDDHPLYRHGLKLLIERQADLCCCGEADSAASARQAVTATKPDILILDLRLGNEDGVELIKSLKTQFPLVPILVVSQHDESMYAERALRAGANGYVMKEEATEEVLSALRTVLAGELYVSRKMAAVVLRKIFQLHQETPSHGLEHLSDREMQIFQLLGRGLSTRKIAEQLFLSFKTVEAHRENIKHKLGLHLAADLLLRAAEWVQGHPSPPPSPQA